MRKKKAPESDLDTLMPLLITIWRRLHKESGPLDRLQTREFRGVVEKVKILNARFDGKETLIGQDYFANPDLLGAYLLYQWVLHYQEGLSLINEIPRTPSRVLDICSGASPFSLAALKHGANEVIATDQSMNALQIGAEICGKSGYPLAIRRWNCLQESLKVEGKFDLIILGHCLEELFPSNQPNWIEKQRHFVRGTLNWLTPEGFLLVVDSSMSDLNRRVLLLRDQLVQENIPVQAPCVWRGECPALKTHNSPCYAQREFEKPFLIREIQRAAEINLSSLKMSYVIFRSPHASWPHLPEKNLYRVISPPIESFQGKRYYLCGTDGKRNLGSHFEKQPEEARAFDYLRRGELISIENSLEKQNSFDIVQGTKVVVEAACSKPLKETESS